jgi:transcriptional regulator with XRE-family HTH domain
MRDRDVHIGMLWKLRRVAAGYRQQDVSTHCGISMTRYRAIERGEAEPTELDQKLVEKFLTRLPVAIDSERSIGREKAAQSAPP